MNLSQKTKTYEKTLARKFKMKEEVETINKGVKYQFQKFITDISKNNLSLNSENKDKLNNYLKNLDNQLGEINESQLNILKELFEDVDLKNAEL